MANGDEFSLNRDTLAVAVAKALQIDRETLRDEAASASARERLVLGAFGSWTRRRWKQITATVAILGTLSGGGWQGWKWLQVQAEQSFLERQATEGQENAVRQNTEAVGQLRTQTGELTDRVGGLETKVEAASDIQQVLLELQLRDPKTKRLIKSDKQLKQKVEALPGVDVQ